MSAAAIPLSHWERVSALRLIRGAGYVLFAAFIFFSSFAFFEPSPYDVIAIPMMLLWFLLGIRLHGAAVPFAVLMLLFKLGIFLGLLPHLDEAASAWWTVQSVYLMATGFFFVMFFSDETDARIELALKAYLASCLLSAVLGIVGYFDVLGRDDLFAVYGRASGTFKDPNVFGSFLSLGALYLMRGLLTGDTRRPVLSLLALLALLAGIFLSFSRGAWAGTVFAATMMAFAAFATAPSPAVRSRIAVIAVVTALFGSAAIAGLLAIGDVAEMFTHRAQVTQDYDEGVTGRFGNQLRSIPMLLESPEGFGPLRFRLIFGLEPHNSYIGGFANGGWLGGFAFLGLVLTTIFVGFRLCFAPSPVQRQAQIAFPALMMFFLQAMQIDIDHWRHVYMLFGMVWALEAARIAWLRPTATSRTPR